MCLLYATINATYCKVNRITSYKCKTNVRCKSMSRARKSCLRISLIPVINMHKLW